MSNLFDINHKKIVITAGTRFWGICRSLKIHCRKRARKDHAPVRAKRFRKPLGCRTREEIQKRKYQIEEAGLVWAVVERVPIHEEIKCWLACIKNQSGIYGNRQAKGVGRTPGIGACDSGSIKWPLYHLPGL